MANTYWKTTAWPLTASTPKTQDVPRMGSSTATAFAVNLRGKRGSALGGFGGPAWGREAAGWGQTQPLRGVGPSSTQQQPW